MKITIGLITMSFSFPALAKKNLQEEKIFIYDANTDHGRSKPVLKQKEPENISGAPIVTNEAIRNHEKKNDRSIEEVDPQTIIKTKSYTPQQ